MTRRPGPPSATPGPLVYIVDDDADVRSALGNLLQSVDLEVVAFGSAVEFLKAERRETPSCLVLDIRLPGMSGLDFQAKLAQLEIDIPIIFMTGFGDVPMAARAFKAGAMDFLLKPFRDQDMLDAVNRALESDRTRRERARAVNDLRKRHRSLSGREAQIMSLVTTGLLNKQIAAKMNLSEITIKVYRGHMMRKMGARTLADLIRISEALGTHAKLASSER